MGEAKTKTPCTHVSVNFDCSANRLDGSNVIIASLAARCIACGKALTFIGHWPTMPTIEEPAITPDGERLLLPMIGKNEKPRMLIIDDAKKVN